MGLCPGVLLSRRVSILGVSVQGISVLRVSVLRMSLSRRMSVQGGVSPGRSVHGVSWEFLSRRVSIGVSVQGFVLVGSVWRVSVHRRYIYPVQGSLSMGSLSRRVFI